jgi:hypothetical protein
MICADIYFAFDYLHKKKNSWSTKILSPSFNISTLSIHLKVDKMIIWCAIIYSRIYPAHLIQILVSHLLMVFLKVFSNAQEVCKIKAVHCIDFLGAYLMWWKHHQMVMTGHEWAAPARESAFCVTWALKDRGFWCVHVCVVRGERRSLCQHLITQ